MDRHRLARIAGPDTDPQPPPPRDCVRRVHDAFQPPSPPPRTEPGSTTQATPTRRDTVPVSPPTSRPARWADPRIWPGRMTLDDLFGTHRLVFGIPAGASPLRLVLGWRWLTVGGVGFAVVVMGASAGFIAGGGLLPAPFRLRLLFRGRRRWRRGRRYVAGRRCVGGRRGRPRSAWLMPDRRAGLVPHDEGPWHLGGGFGLPGGGVVV